MSLVAMLEARLSRVVADWKAVVVLEVPQLASLTSARLADHLPELLRTMTRWLETGSTNARESFRQLAELHAFARQAQAISVEAVVAEYATLRRLLFEHAMLLASAEDVLKVLPGLNRSIDIAVAETVREHAIAKDETRERFIAILAHDLRDPLAAAALSAEQLASAPLEERPHQLAKRVLRSVDRVKTLVSDLLDFARARLGDGIPVAPRQSNMGTLCTWVAEEANAAGGHQVTVSYRGNLEGTWDPERVRQVLANLIRNAKQHGADQVEVHARESDDKQRIVTTVSNRGSVIVPEQLDNIFAPFVRGKEREGGLGLGLYIVKQIVHAHGGTCVVTSDVEAGTRFEIEWPRSLQLAGN